MRLFTLIVDSYAPKYKKYVTSYLALVARFSDLRLIQEAEAIPGYDLRHVDAVLLSGSEKYITRGELTEDYLEFVKNLTIPVLGVCYGHQVLALAHGQDVFRYTYLVRRKYEKNPERIRIHKMGGLFTSMKSPVLVDESHREEVILTDDRFELLGSSPSCRVEAIRLKKTSQFGLQFHLERSGEHGIQMMENFYRLVRRARTRRK